MSEPTDQRDEAEPSGTAVQCLSCGRFTTLDAARHGRVPLVTLTRRLCCSACGSRAVRAERPRNPGDLARLAAARLRRTRP